MKFYSSETTQPEQPNLGLAMRMIALESESAIANKHNFVNALQGLLFNIKGSAMNMFATSNDSELMSSATAALPVVSEDDKDMFHYGPLMVSIPEGFKGKLIPYLIFLTTTAQNINKDAVALIEEYKVVLSSFINSPDSRVALKGNSALLAKVRVRRHTLQKDIDPFFGTSRTSKARLSQVLDRMADLKELQARRRELGNLIKQNNLKLISDMVAEVQSLLEIILQNQEIKDSDTRLSGAAVRNVAEGAQEVAHFVDMTSMFYFRVKQALQATESIIQDVSKLEKRNVAVK